MFEVGSVALTIHVILAGLWLGADLGTFLSFRKVIDPTLSVESRLEMSRYFALIDMGPRSALVAMFGLGIYLSHARWASFSAGWWEVAGQAAMLASVLWLAAVWVLFWIQHPKPGQSRTAGQVAAGKRLATTDLLFRMVVVVFLLTAGVSSITGGEPSPLDVLGWKMVLLAGIVSVGIGLRFILPGVVGAMTDIFVNGSTLEREALLVRRARPTQGLVFIIWTLVIIIIWISVSNIP